MKITTFKRTRTSKTGKKIVETVRRKSKGGAGAAGDTKPQQASKKVFKPNMDTQSALKDMAAEMAKLAEDINRHVAADKWTDAADLTNKRNDIKRKMQLLMRGGKADKAAILLGKGVGKTTKPVTKKEKTPDGRTRVTKYDKDAGKFEMSYE